MYRNYSDDDITAVCTATVLSARRIRRRLRHCGIYWSETRKRFKVHFIASGTVDAWMHEYEHGGKHQPMFRTEHPW